MLRILQRIRSCQHTKINPATDLAVVFSCVNSGTAADTRIYTRNGHCKLASTGSEKTRRIQSLLAPNGSTVSSKAENAVTRGIQHNIRFSRRPQGTVMTTNLATSSMCVNAYPSHSAQNTTKVSPAKHVTSFPFSRIQCCRHLALIRRSP